MAERRMFAKTIIDSDAFLDMPQSSQLLYFHLSMRADDEGFINNPKSIMRNVRCTEEDILQLINKKFIIPFDSGIVVIKHWKIHNYIAKDRFKPTKYQDEKLSLALDENNSYTTCIQNDDKVYTQDRLGQVNLGELSINTNNHPADGYSSEFEKLWELYPRKEGKKSAFASYKRAKKKGVSFEDIESGILNYLEYIKIKKIGAKYIKQGSTWFNGECWNDEYDLTTPKEVTKPQETKSEYNSFMEQLAAMRE